MPSSDNGYSQIIEQVFFNNYVPGAHSVPFKRAELTTVGRQIGMEPKNLGDVIYSFRYRQSLPQRVLDKQPPGLVWAIFPAKYRPACYRFAAVPFSLVDPTPGLTLTKIPDATPGMMALQT